MKHYKKLLIVLLAVFGSFGLSAQRSEAEVKAMYVFPADSVAGFDEPAASAAALANGCYGREFKVFMYREKRKFIIEKYNLVVAQPVEINNFAAPSYNFKSASMPSSGSCNNEDFEDAQANGGPQVGGTVNGWSLFGGTSANYCNPIANNATTNYTVYNSAIIDPIMQAPNNTVASYFDATNVNQPAGSCFIRLNNAAAGAKVVRASKTYTINPNNALFRYAYRAVISDPSHGCCDQPGFHIKVTITNTVTNTSTVLACPNISVAAGTACTGSATPGFITGNTLNGSPSRYNPNWVPGAIDLSAYIGYAVTLNVYAIDCSLSGHAGYVYFDALCAPMTIVGNGTGFPAGTPNITLPTCGASGATITAPPGLGPYSWTSSQISIPATYAVPSNTNQTLVTNQSGTVQLTMNPPGACTPISKVITVTITPAPVALASATQANCTNTLSVASLTTAGSASVNPVISWSPAPASVSSNSLNASGLAVGITTISVTDNTGCYTQATVNILATPPPVTFAVNNVTGSYSLTCLNPTINMTATSGYTYGTISYTWSNVSFTATGSSAAINQAGTYLVCGMDAATSCSSCATFTIDQDFTIPTNTVSPIVQNVTCGNGSIATFTSTALNPTVNIVHNWYNPQNPNSPSSSTNGTTSIYQVAGVLGTHTIEFCNLVNGCCNTKTVSVTSTAGFPAFQTSSTTNYSLGCSPSSMTLCITNVTSAINGPTNYLFLPPGTPSAVPIPTTAFSANLCTVVSTAGEWTVVVNDVTNQCQTAVPVFVLQNTVAPHADHVTTPNSHTLTCFNPTLFAVGSSTTPNTVVTWQIPSNPPTLPTNTLILGPPTGPNTPTNTAGTVNYATYSVIATNTVNGCKTTQTVQVYQNFGVPVPSPLGIGNPSVITCKQDPVIITYTNSTGGSQMIGAVATTTPGWFGPSPQTNLSATNTYTAYTAGTYTLYVTDNKNGCVGSRTVTIGDNVIAPAITEPVKTVTLSCGTGTASGTASINIALTQTISSNNWTIKFMEYPSTSVFGPNATVGNAVIGSGLTVNSPSVSQLITTDTPGMIRYTVSNNINGCTSDGTLNIVPGGLNADFAPDVTTGYAPLTVNFSNNSSTSTGGTIISIWSFGNGATQTTTGTIGTSALYQSPGTYTIMLIGAQGACVDSAVKTIFVELPSKLEVPNVFTPNGDGSNDTFFLKTANLTEIDVVILDRWGNKVYELVSETGNISWDGKNLTGNDSPSGTYFYIIKAVGKDGKSYEQKGNISLYR